MTKTHPKPNIREWIKLISSALIPLMIGVFTVVTTILQNNLSIQQRELDKQEALLQREQSERQATNLRQENVFATYIDDVSKLLEKGNHTNSLMDIRMKTLTTLRQLNTERKQYLLLFLYESELIYNSNEKTSASLLKLTNADFNGMFFKDSIVNPCSFERLYLFGVYSSNSSFIDCFFHRTTFSHAIMYRTIFVNTLLIRILFKSTLLNKANFTHSKLSFIDFSGASLSEVDFTNATFVYDVTFLNTNLSQAIMTFEQINMSTFFNCILPNGTWGPIEKTNLVNNGDMEANVGSI
jgi:uncharacterized protein YjbI with pentapeptide repeats